MGGSDFIPLSESNGNICRLDLYAFEEVCRTIQRWQSAGEPLFLIFVNLSRQHFQKPDCLKSLREIARRYQIPDGLERGPHGGTLTGRSAKK